MGSSSDPLEASVLVNIEASGSSAIPAPGESLYGGAGRLEQEGSRGVGRVAVTSRQSREPGELGCPRPENRLGVLGLA